MKARSNRISRAKRALGRERDDVAREGSFEIPAKRTRLDPHQRFASPRARWARFGRGVAAFTLALLASLSTLPAFADARSLDASNRAFAEGRYEEAEHALEALVREDGFAPGALGNLGNAHLEQDELGEAILAYERARRLDPHDAAVVQNLRVARARAEVSAPAEGRLEALPAHVWRAIGAASLILFVLACVGAGLLRRGRGASVGLSIASGVVVLTCGLALFAHTLGVDRAVVVDGPVTARVSPFAEAEPVFELREGAVVPVRGSHGAFVRVERGDGSAGWTPAHAVERIVPSR